jgi:hypothetical protein
MGAVGPFLSLKQPDVNTQERQPAFPFGLLLLLAGDRSGSKRAGEYEEDSDEYDEL